MKKTSEDSLKKVFFPKFKLLNSGCGLSACAAYLRVFTVIKLLFTTLKSYKNHSFQWRVLCSARSYFKRKIIEGLIIQQRSPTLNKQVNCYVAQLFPSGIT